MGRRERPINPRKGIDALAERRILITGAQGSLGVALSTALSTCDVPGFILRTDLVDERGRFLKSSDPAYCDVTSIESVGRAIYSWQPHIIYHLAAAKHAPEGEEDPWDTLEVNALGTFNVVKCAHVIGAKVLLASTCKACNPETVYGATKLSAERLVLNAGGWVARFYNVVESSGNVFRIWEEQHQRGQPLTVMPADRYFMSLNEAVHLLMAVPGEYSGRYIHQPGDKRYMPIVVKELYPEDRIVNVARRRGDRQEEPLYASHERVLGSHGTALARVESPHDVASHIYV